MLVLALVVEVGTAERSRSRAVAGGRFSRSARAEWRLPDLPSIRSLRMPALAIPSSHYARPTTTSSRDGLDDPDALVDDFVSSDEARSLRRARWRAGVALEGEARRRRGPR